MFKSFLENKFFKLNNTSKHKVGSVIRDNNGKKIQLIKNKKGKENWILYNDEVVNNK